MKTLKIAAWLFLGGLIVPLAALSAADDDPLLYKVMIDKLEWRDAGGINPWVWDAEGWLGKDLNKLWLKSDGARADDQTEEANLSVLYSRALAPFWDAQIGWRHDFQPQPSRDWLSVGVEGIAPYWFEVDAALLAGGNGSLAGTLKAEYELLFTQNLILSPELDLYFQGRDDPARGIGSGVSELNLGLRLRYEVRREFAPYIGINWAKKFGGTADYARADGELTDDLQFVAGVRIWF